MFVSVCQTWRPETTFEERAIEREEKEKKNEGRQGVLFYLRLHFNDNQSKMQTRETSSMSRPRELDESSRSRSSVVKLYMVIQPTRNPTYYQIRWGKTSLPADKCTIRAPLRTVDVEITFVCDTGVYKA